MTHNRWRLFKVIGLAAAMLLVIAVTAGILVARSQWFREFARTQIIGAVERSTGGRVEIAAFRFEWTRLHAEIDNFVLHGSEPAGAAPLFRARRLAVDLGLLSLFRERTVAINALDVLEPRVNLIVLADGGTNVPSPAIKEPSDKTALQTIVDLAIGRLTITNGLAVVSERRMNFSGRGENLRAQLAYELGAGRYKGSLSLDPLILQSAGNPALPVTVNLPVIIESDKVRVEKGLLSTSASRIDLTGQIEHLLDPWVSSQVSARIDLPEIQRTLGMRAMPNAPRVLTADLDFATGEDGFRLSSARAALGKSTLNARGTFNNIAFDKGEMGVQSDLALNELGRIAQPPTTLTGNARLTAHAIIQGRDDIRIHSIVLALAAGEFTGNAAIEQMERYRVEGQLARFDITGIVQAVTSRKVGYGGTVSGTVGASGNWKEQGNITARARLNISPTRNGVPVNGALNVSYDGRRDTVEIGQSAIGLPSSRIDLAGSLGRQIAVRLTSRDLNDFLPAVAAASDRPRQSLPIRFLPGGQATADATIRGRTSSPSLTGHIALARFEASGRAFDLASAEVSASANQVAARNAVVAKGALRMALQASVGLTAWKTTSASPIQATASVRNADILDVLALAGQAGVPLRGALSLNGQASGTVGDPHGNADVSVLNGEAYGETIDRLTARLNIAGPRVDLPVFEAVSGMARIGGSGSFEHPAGSFETGMFRAYVSGDRIALARLKNVRERVQGLDGEVRLSADMEARLLAPGADPRVELVAINGTVAANDLRMQGRDLGILNARVSTRGEQVDFQATSNFAGSSIQAEGRTALDGVYTTTAELNVRDLPIEQVLLVAGRRDLELKGTLGVRGQASGNLRDQSAAIDLNLTRAQYRTQPIDRLQGHVEYTPDRVAITNAQLTAGASEIMLAASFEHPRQDFASGRFTVKAASNSIQLRELTLLEEYRPGLSGAAQLSLEAAGQLNRPGVSTRIALRSLEGDVRISNIQINGRDYGSITTTAQQAGSGVALRLDSTLAQSEIQATGDLQLTADYPVKGELTFTNVRYSNWAALASRSALATGANFDGLLEGRLQVSGLAARPEQWNGRLELGRAELVTTSRTSLSGRRQTLALRNQGPIVAALRQSRVDVQQAHFTGPKTDVVIAGGATLQPQAVLDLTVNSTVDLEILHEIDNDTSSEGGITLNAAIRGPVAAPDIRGRLVLNNAAFQTGDLPNGLSKANGAIAFRGDVATIESLTGESGGGQIRVTGTVSRSGDILQYNLEARAQRVRVRTEHGISAVANANLSLTGTSVNSLLAGRVTLQSLGFTSRTDFGSVLAQASAPAETPSAPQGAIAGMRLNVNIRLAPGAIVQTAMAENLEAEADLTLRGTAARPGMLGRVQLNQGQFVFFGSKYKVNEGSVSFFNPNKIEPVLNLNLETTARGVIVTLAVSGPIQNMTLAYQSDPPLPFDEIVGLLATGRVPTSDPVLVARQPAAPQQSFQQMGASAVMSSAITNPVSGQLQRVFGVSQLKIDPTFTSGSELPQARLTLQQQITSGLTFTYVTNLTRSDPQILRVEWAIDKNWSAIASRQENGIVALDLFYKRRIH